MTQDTTPFVSTEDSTPTAPPEADSASLSPPDPFPGEYRLLRLLGRGAFGEVWLARDLSPLGRLVALKFLHLHPSRRSPQQALEALRNEARILGSLRHPHIVQVYAWRQAGDPPAPCLVLQYVPGGSLEGRVLRDGPLPWQLAARYLADVAEGLLLLHRQGIIHRDVKPANILHDPQTDEALLTDFGISAHLAQQGTIAGTPRYMAPEAFQGQITPALDVYALGATLFWLVTQQAPFEGADTQALLHHIEVGLSPFDPRFAALPRELELLLRRSLACNASDRPSLDSFVRELRGALNHLLADCLTLPAEDRTRPVQLRLLLSRQAHGTRIPLTASSPPQESILRDLRRVPRSPDRLQLRSGQRICVEVVADQPGYLTVFNIGPTGNLNLLYPVTSGVAPRRLEAHEVLPIVDVELLPPTGTERLFALWTRQPFSLQLDELRSLFASEAEGEVSRAYRATRDMMRVQQSLGSLPASDRQVIVLELDHH